MFDRYRAAYAAPGTAAFSAAGFLARAAIAIYPIGLVLIVSARSGHYGYAGVVSGSYVIGGALGNPVAGALVDRYGQHRVLPPFLAAHVAVTVVFAVLVTTHAPDWTLLAPAVLMGFTLLNIGALVRARWSYVWVDDAERRGTAYSIESTLDEAIFVVGPLVATLLATHTDASVTLAAALILVTVGTVWLTRQRATEPPRREHGQEHTTALRYRGMVLLTLAMVCMGGVFGSAEVTMVAFCGQHGSRGDAGWVVACFAGGSGVAGLINGARHWRTSLLRRYVTGACAFGVLPLLYFLPETPAELAGCTFVVGLGIAPTLIGAFGLIDAIVPAPTLTEGLTWIGTGLSVGFGVGASVAGSFADAHGARLGFLLPVCCAVGSTGCALLLGRRVGGNVTDLRQHVVAPSTSAPLP